MASIPNKNVLNGTTNPTTSQFKNEMSNLWEYINAPEFPGEVKLIGTGKISADKNGTGAYIPLTFNAGGSERMRIDTSGNVGINVTPTTSAASRLFVGGDATLVGGHRGIMFNMYYHSTNLRWEYAENAPAFGWADVGYGNMAFLSTGNVSGAAGTAASVNERMRIDSTGNVLVTGSGGLGYGTGAGGTVTQATSKSTAVTLNKPTGQITMNNAALGAGASVAFTLANSTIGGSDVLVVTSSFGSAWNYRIEVRKVVSGFADIYVTNLTDGSLSDALTINFAIIKGATS